MKRELQLEEFTDGKMYTKNDCPKIGCNDCEGCSKCCSGMGDSIVLDPYDIWQLLLNLGTTFEKLLSDTIALRMIDGVILPTMKLSGEEESCPFLNAEGRCTIHSFRPGFCRLFPLGRYYTEGSFYYVLQTGECPKEQRTKVKIQKWIGVPHFQAYEEFVTNWHYFLLDIQKLLQTSENEEEKKTLLMYLINTFYMKPYVTETFYQEFAERLEKVRKMLLL